MKNPFKNIFNYFKNKLQKPNKNNNEAFNLKENKITEATKFETKEPTTELEVKETKEPMCEKGAKMRYGINLINLDNNFNCYKNRNMFSSIPNNLTSKLILEKRDESNDRREINKNFINILKVYATIFEKEKAQNLLDEFFTSKTEVLQKKEAQNVLDALYSPENFENIEERATPKKSFFQITTANTPKALTIPKFIHRTATTGLAHQ